MFVEWMNEWLKDISIIIGGSIKKKIYVSMSNVYV